VSLWAIGVDPLIHGSICILVTFIVTRLFKGTLASTIFLFVFQLGYLVVGYFALNKDTYDISWTMPHCVMTLRLIGLAMDVHDGQKNPVNHKSKL
jgi:lysophospholipid acyltransferase 5